MTLIKREDAVKTVIRKCSPICAWQVGTQQYPDCVVAEINALPSDAVDCTDFIEWLVDRVLDETMWENNSVAYGEIICRKLEKLGVLEVTEEPSYYIRPSADAVKRVDCSNFLLWLLEEIMDEDNWEFNAVADGEIIARKLKKLGLLEVKDGYYHRIFDENVWVVRCKDCEYADFNSPYPVCNFLEMNICENGYCSWARMKGGADE